MARTRSIKPGFFDNDVLGDLSPLTRLLFIGLWCIADREGRLEDRPRKIKKAVLGYDDVDSDGVEKMLQSLQNTGFIIRYEAEGDRFIQIINFVKHQNPHMKEKGSEIPPPAGFDPGSYIPTEHGGQEEHHASTMQAPDEHGVSLEAAQPITGTPPPIPDEEPDEDEPEDDKPKGILEKRFDLFWKAYPKKKAKKTAWNAFKKVKPDDALFSLIMEAIGRYRTSQEWQRDSGQFIPHPATWLNGGCWDDEIEEAKKSAEHSGYSGGNGGGKPATTPTDAGKSNATAGFKSADDE